MIHPARYGSLGELLEDACLQYPSDTACIEVDRDRELARLTFADVRETVARVCGWLTSRGLGAEARVGIVLANQSAWLLAAAAVLRRGGVLVPLDARLTAAEQRTLLAHAQVDALVVDAHRAGELAGSAAHVVAVGHVPSRGMPDGVTPWDEVVAHAPDASRAPRARGDVAAIVYSSGTGGDPKGCKVTHGNYLAQYQALMETFTWKRGDRYFSILPTNHAIDFMCGFIAAWSTGTTVIHQRTLRPELIVKTMRRYRVTTMSVVPMVLEALHRGLTERLDDQPEGRRKVLDALATVNGWLTTRTPSHDVSRWLLKPVHDAFGGHLRLVFCGGAFTRRDLAEDFHRLGIPVVIGYGLTEACTVATVQDLHPFRADSVGKPVPGVDVRIADAGADGVGEVWLRGPTVFAGYLDDAEQTAEALVDGWLRTGDLGWVDAAHHLHLVGRRKNMIVTAGGKNVYPEDVEAALTGVGVDDLCVAAADWVWPRDTAAEARLTSEHLVAIVRGGEEVRATARTALQRANRALPEHKRLGGVLWWEDAFPRTASLKVKRADLAAQVRARATRADVEAL